MHKIGTTELLLILAIALVIFGPKALPKLGHSIGKTLGMFKKGIREDADENTTNDTVAAQPAQSVKETAPSEKE